MEGEKEREMHSYGKKKLLSYPNHLVLTERNHNPKFTSEPPEESKDCMCKCQLEQTHPHRLAMPARQK